jgi:predicted GIY-YIG superfamily endonuclease
MENISKRKIMVIYNIYHIHHKLCSVYTYVPVRPLKHSSLFNGTVSDKPRRLLRHQRAQAHNSTHYRRQHSFMYWLCSKQNRLLCAYECDFGDNDKMTIVLTGLTTTKICCSIVSIKSVSDFFKCNRPIDLSS